MNPHFFTVPFYFAFIWFRVQGSGFRVQVAASPPFFRRWYSRIAVLRAFLPAANSLKRDTPKEADGWQRSENE